jgi:hypothetical protein
VPIQKRKQIWDAAGLTPQPAALAEGVSQLLQDLASRSSAAALRNMRKGEWPATESMEELNLRQYLPLGIPEGHPVAEHLVELCKQVVAEEEGSRPPGQLAGAAIQTLSGQTADADQTWILQHVFMATIRSIQ